MLRGCSMDFTGFCILLILSSLQNIAIGSGTITCNGSQRCLQIFGHKISVRRSVKSLSRNLRHSSRHSANEQREGSVTKCPPPMANLPSNVCFVDPCQSDSECTLPGQKCCYNGCLNTCVHVVQPPPLIDWRTRSDENLTGDTSGNSDYQYDENLEFDVIPGEVLMRHHLGGFRGEMCSDTEVDGDLPMECPHGYECHIEHPGDLMLGIPNRGICIAVNENAPEDISILHEEYTDSLY